ncbi:hypothetical protein [Pelosinus fermentans]|uniref:Outer membrane protein beta-barrel domain-containing protein n=1 Tax=Pelosinus fermentans JBW45 TaxID=1192197 RepID=I9DEH2_9FIRM|nr:hypothetical protein [Pelosinus fermentans]AJQ28587.1 hypothetical protein JBW_03246 [Pelosinus fermentans JBW45]
MKKKIFTLMAGTMLATSIGYAAPLTELAPGETTIGYNHYNLDQNGHGIDDDSVYIEHALSDKFTAGIERNGYSSYYGGSHTTDIYVHYKLDNNVRLIAGDRNYSGESDKFFYGVGVSANLAPRLDGYASVITNSVETGWQTGLNYAMDGKTSLNLGYKSDKHDHSSTRDGVGFGINHKF